MKGVCLGEDFGSGGGLTRLGDLYCKFGWGLLLSWVS